MSCMDAPGIVARDVRELAVGVQGHERVERRLPGIVAGRITKAALLVACRLLLWGAFVVCPALREEPTGATPEALGDGNAEGKRKPAKASRRKGRATLHVAHAPGMMTPRVCGCALHDQKLLDDGLALSDAALGAKSA